MQRSHCGYYNVIDFIELFKTKIHMCYKLRNITVCFLLLTLSCLRKCDSKTSEIFIAKRKSLDKICAYARHASLPELEEALKNNINV